MLVSTAIGIWTVKRISWPQRRWALRRRDHVEGKFSPSRLRLSRIHSISRIQAGIIRLLIKRTSLPQRPWAPQRRCLPPGELLLLPRLRLRRTHSMSRILIGILRLLIKRTSLPQHRWAPQRRWWPRGRGATPSRRLRLALATILKCLLVLLLFLRSTKRASWPQRRWEFQRRCWPRGELLLLPRLRLRRTHSISRQLIDIRVLKLMVVFYLYQW